MKRNTAPCEQDVFQQPIYTQEQRLGECILLLCGRSPSHASAISKMLDEAELSNGSQIIEHHLKAIRPTFQRGLPIVGQENDK